MLVWRFNRCSGPRGGVALYNGLYRKGSARKGTLFRMEADKRDFINRSIGVKGKKTVI